MKTVLIVLAFAAVTYAEKWKGLGVTWDLNIIKYPIQMPRTVKDAVKKGWKVADSGTCGGTNNYQGIAYTKDNDRAVTLLFDTNGYIAGFQTGISIYEKESSGFPTDRQMPPFVLDGFIDNYYVVSAYFTEPSQICSKGRTKAEFDSQGTGTNLYIQNGNSTLKVPRKLKDLQSPWVEGKCFWTMGKHYWYRLSDDMSCDEMFPVFLLYNDDELNGFGWAFLGDLSSKSYEHPDYDKFDKFMKRVPKCLKNAGKISTMHVFMDNHPSLNRC